MHPGMTFGAGSGRLMACRVIVVPWRRGGTFFFTVVPCRRRPLLADPLPVLPGELDHKTAQRLNPLNRHGVVDRGAAAADRAVAF